ncbi:MAG: hypothetical protein WCO07_01485 [bacterium]
MKLHKKTSIAGEWAKPKEDINQGDVIEILNEGATVSGEYGDRQVFKIKTKNGEKNLSFNQTSLNYLIDAYGDDTKTWVGKKANVTIIKMNVSGKFRDIVYIYGIGWEMQEDGSVKKIGVQGAVQTSVEYPEDDINPEDIPF